jgi:hypothetical protein
VFNAETQETNLGDSSSEEKFTFSRLGQDLKLKGKKSSLLREDIDRE